MKHSVMLIRASLLTTLLLSFHLTDDVLREGGLAVKGAWNLMVLARTVVANEVARAKGDYFFVWTLLALGVTGLVSFVLSARGLWSRQWGQPR